MAEILLTGVEEAVLHRLQERAIRHGRTPPDEAKAILTHALHTPNAGAWSGVDSIFERLSKTGQQFTDSAELLREDRDR